VVVDAESGLVVVDRDTVPVALGDVNITFGATLTVPAQVRWIHPEHNLAIVQYDPADMGDAPIVSAAIDPRPLDEGDAVWQVGLDQRDQLVGKATEVQRLRAAQLPLPSPPFFREVNLEVVDTESAAWSMGGVLADKKGRVRALWASFVDLSGEEPDAWFAGVPSSHLLDALAHLRAGGGDWPAVGAELVPVPLSVARDLGLDGDTLGALAAADPDRVVLGVTRVAAGSPAADALREGDLVLRVDGELVTTPGAVEAALRTGGATLDVLRRGAVQPVPLAPWMLDAGGTRRAVGFAGALVHAPHAAVAQQRGIEPSGVYVAWYWYGSPAGRYGLRPTRRIVAVDETPTPDLDAFLEAVGERAVGDSVRLETVDLQGRRKVLTLEVDPVYWPTYELRRGDDGWERLD
jgi:S1-C subfamily serine protease